MDFGDESIVPLGTESLDNKKNKIILYCEELLPWKH